MDDHTATPLASCRCTSSLPQVLAALKELVDTWEERGNEAVAAEIEARDKRLYGTAMAKHSEAEAVRQCSDELQAALRQVETPSEEAQ